MERKGIVSQKGSGLTLIGPDIKAGDRAPDFAALDGGMKPVRLSDYRGKIVIISAVPSLDTKVCELQTIKFNEEAAKLNAVILTISMDLPFAQTRFCHTLKIDKIKTISDFKDREFANAYGLYIKETGLIARSVFVIDKEGMITYRQIVKDISEQPDYDTAVKEAKKLGA
jgi:thioredoxin-dependent peroxiredoxin